MFYQINSSDESEHDSITIPLKPHAKKVQKRSKGSKKSDKESGSESEGQIKLNSKEGPVLDLEQIIKNYNGPVK